MSIYNDERPEHIRGAIYLAVIGLFAVYQVVNAFVANADMILAVRIIACAIYAAVLYVYAPDAWTAASNRDPERGDFLIVGIWLSFAGHLGQGLYAIAYRLAEAPAWLLNAEVIAPITIVSAIAGVLHVSAPGAFKGTVPRRNRYALALALALGVLALGVLLTTRPDIKPIIDRARPYIGDFFRTGDVETHGPPPA
ncbi:hypothetical protein G3T14_21740 [Methylobacterium sp. BTF04]|uniref:hypothetical protein n=1 Tax=Methylobacterium sp. BTF04 TaxID=2708300 RepID=UPI0013D3C067|nr:hypothetical protein [Methylobacterium sp. BTF04]NEU14705.1 hypothetical protein [Methylobacterium sp. BTF04]